MYKAISLSSLTRLEEIHFFFSNFDISNILISFHLINISKLDFCQVRLILLVPWQLYIISFRGRINSFISMICHCFFEHFLFNFIQWLHLHLNQSRNRNPKDGRKMIPTLRFRNLKKFPRKTRKWKIKLQVWASLFTKIENFNGRVTAQIC